jgi:hypothetical protein
MIVRDTAATARQLAAGHYFRCPWDGCAGSLGPWGSARTRPVRPSWRRYRLLHPKAGHMPDVSTLPGDAPNNRVPEARRQRRDGLQSRCPGGERRRTPQSCSSGWGAPKRPCADGCVGPERTQKSSGPTRRCRCVRSTRWHRGSTRPAPLLGDMLEAVGLATMAWEALLGQRPPVVPRLEVSALLTGGELLMPNPAGFAYWPIP